MAELPQHIAIVMDGNGRWAQKRNLARNVGHKAGGEAAKEVIKICTEKKIKALTLFAFGIENWQRPEPEVKFLMDLFLKNLQKNTPELHKNNIKLRIIGDHTKFSPKLRDRISQSQKLTAANTGLQLNAAINYSGRWDILNAVKKLAHKSTITESDFQAQLCLADLPEPDLFIRTSGEQRLSNFLLWQLAYTELYFTKVLWPDFNKDELEKALADYAKRERRFGGVGAGLPRPYMGHK